MLARSRVLTLAGLLAVALGATTLVPGTASATPPRVTPDLTVTPWASGIADPWDVAFLPDGDALITSKTTGVVHLRRTDGSLSSVSADQSDFRSAGESGLMGIAVDPQFRDNGDYYTCQSSTRGDIRVIRWRLDDARTRATRMDVVVDDIPLSSGRHGGCRLAFGYEGYLWITTGDAATSSVPQDLRSLGGKVLRVDPRSGRGHPRNPFYSGSGSSDRSKIFTYGHRNPQGIGRRPCTRQMWTGEHGPSRDDEINLLVGGANYGWDPLPGYGESVPMTDFSLPGPQKAAKWRSGAPTIALSGVGWIRGADWGGWDGELAGATLKNAQLWVFEFSNRNRLTDTDIPPELDGRFGRLRVPVMGPDGALYVASQSTGTVYRVVPDAGPVPSARDLNGDGYDDLLVGAPGDRIRGRDGAGAFNVVYGAAGGLHQGRRSELRDQGDIKGAKPQTGDGLGSSLASGDLDGDGIADVVAGAPGEGSPRRSASGAVHTICGRTNGVEERSSQTFSEAGSVRGKREAGDRFASAVAVGDFNGDGRMDIVSGTPGENHSGQRDAGAVHVLYSTPAGVSTERSAQISRKGLAGAPGRDDALGYAVAVGDFDADGYDDVAVGAPGDTVAGEAGAGSLNVIYGSAAGLTTNGSVLIDQTDIPGDNAAGDRFGEVLAAGDFDGDGHDDLAVGAPSERVGGVAGAGQVTVLAGSPTGLGPAGAVVLDEPAGVGPAPGARVGAALAAGDADGDGRDELAVGSPGHRNEAGQVIVLEGGPGGLVAGQRFTQAGPVPGSFGAGRDFGAAVAFGDFDRDGRQDLAVGAPGTNVKGRADAGAIVILPGSPAGVTAEGSRRITRATPGVPGRPGAGDRFGAAL